MCGVLQIRSVGVSALTEEACIFVDFATWIVKMRSCKAQGWHGVGQFIKSAAYSIQEQARKVPGL